MYPLPLLSKFTTGDTTVLYFLKDQQVAFSVIPTAMAGKISPHQRDVNDTRAARAFHAALKIDLPAVGIEPLTQVHLLGDAHLTVSALGSSMHVNGPENPFRFLRQDVKGREVHTILEDGRGHELRHVLTRRPGSRYFEVRSEFTNKSKTAVVIDYLESFNLSQLSLFQQGAGEDQYRIHRFRSFWSSEGRECIETPEELGLEASWARFAQRAVRFGQRSTAPVREYFPSIVLEDAGNGISWGVQLAVLGPWQLEIGRMYDFLYLSGGCPDHEFGGWYHTVKAGQSYIGPTAVITCVRGSSEEAMSRLTDRSYEQKECPSPADRGFPLMFNEFCTTWGNPYPEAVLPELKRARELGVKFFTLDDGWFTHLGDWGTIKKEKYPQGFGKFIQAIRDAGFIPGLWFEPEHLLNSSELFKKHPELLLTLDGKPLRQNARYVLDMRKKSVWRYLDRTMAKTIRTYGIGYIKIDYNTAFTAADSLNGSDTDAAQEYVQAVHDYYRHLKELFPELVIEICASGGHRTTAEWVRFGDQASVTDAHESLAIPFIAANMLLQVPMSTSQLWATLRTDDTPERLSYTLCSAFLGRLCFSGYLSKLDKKQFAIVKAAADAYDWARPFIPKGDNHILRQLTSASYDNPKGWQAVTRRIPGKDGAMTVIHFFGDAPKTAVVPLPDATVIQHLFAPAGTKASLKKGQLVIGNIRDFSAIAVWT